MNSGIYNLKSAPEKEHPEINPPASTSPRRKRERRIQRSARECDHLFVSAGAFMRTSDEFAT